MGDEETPPAQPPADDEQQSAEAATEQAPEAQQTPEPVDPDDDGTDAGSMFHG